MHPRFKILIPAVLALCLIYQIGYSLKLGNNVSPIADGHSESNSIRAAEGFVEQGLFAYWGLADIAYGEQFPDQGALRDEPGIKKYVYTHYPPGPDWLTGLARMVCGKGHIPCFRILPLTVSSIGAAYFLATLASSLSLGTATTLILLSVIAPMFCNMMHGLHQGGYAFAMLLVQLSILLRVFGKKAIAITRPRIAALGLLGFLQGWSSFDYAFLVTFAAVPFLIKRHAQEGKPPISAWIWLIGAPGAGFMLAHILHGLQVWAYLGSFEALRADFGTAAQRRFDNTVETVARVRPEDLNPIRLVFQYYTRDSAHGRFFGYPLGALIALIILALAFRAPVDSGIARLTRNRLKWSPCRGAIATVLSAVLVSSLWILVMRAHAAVHTHFVPRHLFLSYFFALWVALESLQSRGETRSAIKATK